MAIAVNTATQGTPIASGKTGTQVVKFVPCPRVYVKAATEALVDTPVNTHFTKLNGSAPSGFTDLGIVNGLAKITYTKDVEEVRTGWDQVLRASFVKQKTAEIEFTLQQVDDVVLEAISGLTASIISSGSIVNFQIGQEDLVTMAMILAVTSKVDSKEIQYYNPYVYMNFAFEEADNALALKCTGRMTAFRVNGASKDSLMSVSVFA